MSAVALGAVLAYSLLSIAFSVILFRRDVYFATFFGMIVLYSVLTQWGYLLYPEISEFVIRMYFGEQALVLASVFASLSLVALFACHSLVYRRMVGAVSIRMVRRRPQTAIYLVIATLNVAILVGGYALFREDLSYANASDDQFLAQAGFPYKIFWQIYKLSVFTLLILFALLRSRSLAADADRWAGWALLAIHAAVFVLITTAVGSRTDPLALTFGVLGYEYCLRRSSARSEPVARRTIRWTTVLGAVGIVVAAVTLLSALESSRVEGGVSYRDDIEASALVQAVLLKDYYTPFHVLIGAIDNGFVAPATVLASNAANTLMFLGVDYLQFFVVEQWSPGTVSRTASPAMFCFTEGFVFAGWVGWLYNGIVWSVGIALWRWLSRTEDEHFNSIAFAVTVALAATVARSQSSYFLKNMYLLFAPSLALYAVASGSWPTGLSFRRSARRRFRSVDG